ncbi:wHTH domain-containing protein [Streptomyces johnsoniae]|uniref:Caspase family protein n=1 Tax=Streptomyces johnsoniae TaxID=3075532 RepID=A0ABU2RXU1_9ACTN|nr:caspase family protein [Streptomyces sp. DSM 41886]MDT0441567.1 caspase family protein [Streptomyces sp. DSM 41886]
MRTTPRTSFKALLIGVPAYRDEAIGDLPFVADDLAELADALRATGYDVDVHDVAETDRDSLDQAVEDVLQQAAEGQTVLIYLSGHGVNHDGIDYLVPRGARTRAHDFRSRCLPLDFSAHVSRSRAGDVVVFVDACREGITLQETSGGDVVGWSRMRVRRVGDRHYCHVYACSPGERARYAATAAGSFSLFSRALSAVVADEEGPGTLGSLKEALQDGLDALTAEHGFPRQRVGIRAETDIDACLVIPRLERAAAGTPGEHPWTALARTHPVWQQVDGGPGTAALREAAAAFVTRLAERSDADARLLAADPWRPAGFAERMTDRVGWLLTEVLNQEKLDLSPAEAALLTILPFLHAAHRDRTAVRSLGAAPEDLGRAGEPSEERAQYERFFEGRPRLVRRWHRADADAGGIAWWLFHQWLHRRPFDRDDPALRELTAGETAPAGSSPTESERRLIADVLNAETQAGLLRALRMSLKSAPDGPARQLAGASVLEQGVRERLLAALLTVAHRLAIDPTRLPEVVVDHLGIWYSVDLAELHRTLENARWDSHGRTRVLNGVCTHPAVELALRQQAAALDELLGSLDTRAGSEPQWRPLQDLPAHATADGVRAATAVSGGPVYESTDLRFRLADDRIQELLMGEQLYGDPDLAIRELYQNALDAARYRAARTAFLRHRGISPAPWSGRITFTQGEEDGRAYLECTDNGIGMGEQELCEVFSQAGMRFADLPEFLAEQAAWRAEGIHLHANSRFGIGVLSYFMIADDIRVTTCRLDREGHPGDRLQVDIAGPGALFRIRRLGRGHDAGTTVRLYLRSPERAPSCVRLLRRLLWLSEFTVTATDGAETQRWRPGVLSPAAPLDEHFPGSPGGGGEIRTLASARPQVWWCGRGGGILADGLWAGAPLFGAVVNLEGPHVPRLSVDRNQMLEHDRGHVGRLLREQIPALLAPGAGILDHEWASILALQDPRLADEVFARAVAAGFSPWTVGGQDVDAAAVGCFQGDATRFSRDQPLLQRVLFSVPFEHVPQWRALAWIKAGAFPGVTVTEPETVALARPSDTVLLSLRGRLGAEQLLADSRWIVPEWLPGDAPVPLGHILRAARDTGRTPADVADRLTHLGYSLPPRLPALDEIRDDDLPLLSRSANERQPWLTPAETVPPGHLMFVARETGRTPADIADRLTHLGHTLPAGPPLPVTPHPDDITLLSRNADMLDPWLDPAEPVPAGHLLYAARETGRTPADIADRLTHLGHTLPTGPPLPDTPHPEDATLLSIDLDAQSPWLDPAKPVPAGHVHAAADATGRTPEDVVARLAAYGYAVPPRQAGPDDLPLLSEDLDGAPRWWSPERPVPLGHILRAAEQTLRTPQETAARLVTLGHRVPAPQVMAEPPVHGDTHLLSVNADGRRPWLAAEEPVTPGHVLRAAQQTARTPAEVAARLVVLGHAIAEGTVLPDEVRPDDVRVLSADLDGQFPWLAAGKPVPAGHILRAAARTGRTPAEVAGRLAELGLPLPPGVRFGPAR